MSHFQVRSQLGPSGGDGAREYLFDMIAELAKLARKAGEGQVAIFLEAILAARRVTLEDASS